MKEVLESKHPAQAEANPKDFIDCNQLSVIIDFDVTAEHVAKVAKTLSGSAGLSGVDSQQWNELLLKFGKPSEELREAVASLTRRIANNIIPWKDIGALKAKKLKTSA